MNGIRNGKHIVVFNDDGTILSTTTYKSINEAKKANRTTQYPTVKPSGVRGKDGNLYTGGDK